MSCEDFPCCGHEYGCCPSYDHTGRQTNMICVCGAELPIDNPTSICNSCLRDNDDFEDMDDARDWEDDCYDESMDGDFDTGMASAGFGTDEDYNGYDYRDEDMGDFGFED